MIILDTEYLSGMIHDVKISHVAKYSILYQLASLCLLCIGRLLLNCRHYYHAIVSFALIISYLNSGPSPTLRLTCTVVDLSHMLASTQGPLILPSG